MLRSLLSTGHIPHSLHVRCLSFGIKKDQFGYPIRPCDTETEEPKDTIRRVIRDAPPPRFKTSNSHNAQTKQSVLVYKEFLKDDQRNIRRFFEDEKHDSFPVKVKQVEFKEGMIRTGLIARKHGETRSFLRSGDVVVSTYLEIQDNFVMSCDPVFYKGHTGRLSMRLAAFEADNVEDLPLSQQREFYSIGMSPKQVTHDFLITPEQALPINYKLDISHFFVGQYLDIRGLTINRGYQGVIRRWGYKGQGKFGRTKTHRRPGSISTQGLARVLKGKKLPGIMGNKPHTTHSAQILYANYKDRYLLVQGSVQGVNGCFLYLSDAMGKDPIQGPLCHYPTFLGERTALGEQIYDNSTIDPTEQFDKVFAKRREKLKW